MQFSSSYRAICPYSQKTKTPSKDLYDSMVTLGAKPGIWSCLEKEEIQTKTWICNICGRICVNSQQPDSDWLELQHGGSLQEFIRTGF